MWFPGKRLFGALGGRSVPKETVRRHRQPQCDEGCSERDCSAPRAAVSRVHRSRALDIALDPVFVQGLVYQALQMQHGLRVRYGAQDLVGRFSTSGSRRGCGLSPSGSECCRPSKWPPLRTWSAEMVFGPSLLALKVKSVLSKLRAADSRPWQ